MKCFGWSLHDTANCCLPFLTCQINIESLLTWSFANICWHIQIFPIKRRKQWYVWVLRANNKMRSSLDITCTRNRLTPKLLLISDSARDKIFWWVSVESHSDVWGYYIQYVQKLLSSTILWCWPRKMFRFLENGTRWCGQVSCYVWMYQKYYISLE